MREAGSAEAGRVDADPTDPTNPTDREQILAAMGLGPDGVAGPGNFVGGQGDMAEARRWLALPGLTLPVILDEIRRVAAAKPDGPAKSFRYFAPVLQRLSGQLAAPPLTPSLGPPARAAPAGVDPLTASLARLEAEGRI